jgi:four helix bundle protein
MHPYRQLLAWQACHALNLAIIEMTARWPSSERFELSSQLRRAAWSAAANIVEGSARRGPREFRRFLDISLGSLAELEYGLELARDRALLTDERYEVIESIRSKASRVTWGLYNRIRTL